MTGSCRAAVSIIVTAYNYERFVVAAIESALAQGPRVEVIVVDDGSTDNTPAVLAPYADRVTVIRQDNGGQGAAFTAGIEAAGGELIMLLDADDVLLPEAVDRLRSAASDHPDAVMFQHRLTMIDGDGHPTGETMPEPGRPLVAGDLRSRLLAAPDDIPWQPASGLAFRRHAVSRVVPIPAEPFRICADVYLMNTVALYGPVAAIEEPGAGYRTHGTNAHLRTAFDLDRLRTVIERADVTHAEIERRGREIGLLGPSEKPMLRSVTDHAGRLVALRLDRPAARDRAASPRTAGTTRLRAVAKEGRAGVESAWLRPDIGIGRKAMMTGWFALAAVAPRPVVRSLAALALTR